MNTIRNPNDSQRMSSSCGDPVTGGKTRWKDVCSVILCGTALIALSAAGETIVNAPLGARMDKYVGEHGGPRFSGAFLAAVDGEVVLKKGYGLADREAGTAVTAETVFDIGSLTKQFTAAGIMKLAVEGKVSVSDPVTKFFEEVPADKREITVHHLMTHASGLPDSLGDDYEETSREALVRLAMEAPLKHAPGTGYLYSNVGYSLLAAIIEIASGMSYEGYLRERFFGPLGMNDTGYVGPTWDKARVAVGYGKEGRWGTPLDQAWAPDGPYWHLKGNGGMLSTLGDMHAWLGALSGNSVLPPSAREAMFTPHQKEGKSDSHYGYGWVIAKTEQGAKVIMHNGGNGIFFADAYWYPESDTVFIVLTNHARGLRSMQKLREMMLSSGGSFRNGKS